MAQNILGRIYDAMSIDYRKDDFTDLDVLAFLSDLIQIRSEVHDTRRWWTEYLNVARFENTYVQYVSARRDGDVSAVESGWKFDLNSIEEVEPVEMISVVYRVVSEQY